MTRENYLNKLKNQTRFIQGDEAAAYGALYAGCNFFAGYPITPASEVAELMAKELPKTGGYYIQMEDEIASMGALIGAAWSGGKSMTATSGPGFSLMQENIGYACMTETPCVIVNVQRSGPSTGQATMGAQGDMLQARWGTHGDHEMIALSPSSVQESFDLMIEAFNLSEKFRNPVIFLLDGEVGHIREKVVFPDVSELNIYPHKSNGMRDVVSLEAHDTLIRRLNDKIESCRNEIARYKEHFTDDMEYLVVSYGASARPSMGAVLKLREKGFRIGFLRLITIWPFASTIVKELGKKANKIFVPEMNLGQISREIERFVSCDVLPVSKIGGVPHTINEIAEYIEKIIVLK